jgi:hypothetical protein
LNEQPVTRRCWGARQPSQIGGRCQPMPSIESFIPTSGQEINSI